MVQEIERLAVSEFLKADLGGENYRIQTVVDSLKKAGYNTVGIIREIKASGSDITWNDRDGYTSYEMTFYLDVVNPEGLSEVLRIYFNISYDKQEAEVAGHGKAKTIAENVLKEHYAL